LLWPRSDSCCSSSTRAPFTALPTAWPGCPKKMGRLFLLVLAAFFTAVAVPGGTLSGAGLMVYDAARRGRETARAVLANLIFFLLDYLAFLVVLALK